MNYISTTRYIIIIIFVQDTLLIIGTINNRIWSSMVEEEGFGAFKNNIIIVLF